MGFENKIFKNKTKYINMDTIKQDIPECLICFENIDTNKSYLKCLKTLQEKMM